MWAVRHEHLGLLSLALGPITVFIVFLSISIGYKAAGPIHGMVASDNDNAVREHLLVGGFVGWLVGGCFLGFTPPLPHLGVGQVLCLRCHFIPFPPCVAKKRLGQWSLPRANYPVDHVAGGQIKRGFTFSEETLNWTWDTLGSPWHTLCLLRGTIDIYNGTVFFN